MRLDLAAQLIELGLAGHLVEAGAELGGHAAHLGHELADLAHQDGRSFGPTTIRATTPTIRKSKIRPSGNIAVGLSRRSAATIASLLSGRSGPCRLGKGERLDAALVVLVALQAVSEGADALGGVAHQAGKLPRPPNSSSTTTAMMIQ